MKPKDLSKIVEESQKFALPCTICEEPTRGRGIFTPDGPAEVGIGEPPQNSRRYILFALCYKHPRDAYTIAIVEEIIRNKVSSGRNKADMKDTDV